MKALTEAKQQNLEVSRKQSSEIHSPMFSVIVPVYNVAPYLNECLDSVFAQTFTDWECLCTDDGSHDASGPILDSYARRDPRFRITHQRNAGVSSARNRALKIMRGERICFVDADDDISTNYLLSFNEVTKGGTVDLLLGTIVRDSPMCSEERDSLAEFDVGINAGKTISDLHLLEDTFSWGKCFKASLFKKDVFFPNGIAFSEDMIFIHRVLKYVTVVGGVPLAQYHYRTRGNSASRRWRTWKEYVAIANLVAEGLLKLYKRFPNISVAYRHMIWEMAYYGHLFLAVRSAYLCNVMRSERISLLKHIFARRDILRRRVCPHNRMKQLWWRLCLRLPTWFLDIVFVVCARNEKLWRFFPG